MFQGRRSRFVERPHAFLQRLEVSKSLRPSGGRPIRSDPRRSGPGKDRASTTSSLPDTFLSAKFKSWFAVLT